MERTVAPVLGEGHSSLSEWKYLSGILSASPIDISQLDFYMLMANKSSNSGIQSTGQTVQKGGQVYEPLKKNSNSQFDLDSSPNRQRLNFGNEPPKLSE